MSDTVAYATYAAATTADGGPSSPSQQSQQQPSNNANAAANANNNNSNNKQSRSKSSSASSPQSSQQQHQSQHHAPSKVLHIRGLPPYTNEHDLLQFFSTIAGVVPTRILILPNSNQAFIQLNSIEASNALLQQQASQNGNLILKGNK